MSPAQVFIPDGAYPARNQQHCVELVAACRAWPVNNSGRCAECEAFVRHEYDQERNDRKAGY